MVSFISFLRAIATCLITNAHYTGIYPSDLIANGGLLGDVIFFAVSGYCLCDVKKTFFAWYGKRIYRCYLPVVIITVVYLILGFYRFQDNSFFYWFIYPTYYHFVASITILYIPYYFVMRCLKDKIFEVMVAVAIIGVVIYVFVYDKTYYHVDNVREPFIRFLFFECMLLGAVFRQNYNSQKNVGNGKWYVFATGTLFLLYFASKMLFSQKNNLASFQIINQILIFSLLYCVLKVFSIYNAFFEKMPASINGVVVFLSKITLEIYVVQYVIIDLVKQINLPFPINWFVLTVCIVVVAYMLNQCCNFVAFIVSKALFVKSKGQIDKV